MLTQTVKETFRAKVRWLWVITDHEFQKTWYKDLGGLRENRRLDQV